MPEQWHISWMWNKDGAAFVRLMEIFTLENTSDAKKQTTKNTETSTILVDKLVSVPFIRFPLAVNDFQGFYIHLGDFLLWQQNMQSNMDAVVWSFTQTQLIIRCHGQEFILTIGICLEQEHKEEISSWSKVIQGHSTTHRQVKKSWSF